MSRDGRPARFRRFRAYLVDHVADYWRTSDTASLESARRTLREFTASLGQGVNEFEIYLDGWLGPSRSHRLTARTLRKANPGYLIGLQRTLRMDVAQALATRKHRLGFRVRISAREHAVLPPFVFGVTDRSGNLVPLPHSNDEVTEAMGQPNPRSRVVLVEPPPGQGSPPQGYLDQSGEMPKVSGRNPRTWLAVLASEQPRELFELVDAEGMEESAAAIADSLPELDMDPEWSDRFMVLATASLPDPKSDLHLVNVRRPRPAQIIGGGSPVMMPILKRRGAHLRAVAGTSPIPIPEQGWLRLENATLQDGGTVFAGGELVAYERAADPTLDFVAGQWDSVLGSRSQRSVALVRHREPAASRFDSGVVLSGRNDNNWYHWLIEYLPRALQLDASVPDDAPFVVSMRTPQSGIDALSALSSRDVLRLDSQFAHHFDTLHVLAPPVEVLDTTKVSWRQGLSLNPEPLRAARKIWTGEESAGTERVFLRRRSAHRGLHNEAELVEIAEAHGLTIIDPGQLTWAEQVALFSTAALVVGASGAVMGNYLLMPKGSEVLAITSHPLSDFILPAAIAHVGGVGFSYVLGEASTKLTDHGNRNTWLHSDFSIKPRHFTSALRQAIERIG
jgi:capsular polysaccharide biosynthesis protein